MVTTVCKKCGAQISWKWESTFISHAPSCHREETWEVKTALFDAGYGIEISDFITNPHISAVFDKAWIPPDEISSRPPNEDPRSWLPVSVVNLLDRVFPGSDPRVVHTFDNERSPT